MEEALFNQLSNSAKIGKCRTVSDFERMGKIGEGTYGIVYKAKDKKTGTVVALKRVRMESETDGIPLTSLREIKVLQSIKHPNIVEMLEVVVGPHVSDMFLCFEFCDHTLSELIYQIGNPFTEGEIKRLMLQLLSALAYTHERRIIHRDIKMSNLLYTNTGLLKLADFGLARLFDQPPLHYTPNVVTLWYRPPELLFGDTLYSTALDMWSAGCIFAEFLKGRPLFPGKTEAHQIELIFQILGSPSEQIWPSFINLPRVHEFIIPHKQKSQLKEKFGQLSQNGLELLQGLLTLDPDKRIKMQDALTHPYFREFPIPKSVFMMPKYPSTNNPIQTELC
ncbi:MAG: putative Cyclin-dependent kinase 10 [Streblomastix strix]|uniref:cyclin-dependent kinase n=1 Tax=Streblomastix strix TaxID=222440 RepID=A0A5J4WX77_9EUKA|nr:MAG: putative Cyclin-dependent kinase 10 [Streblomastix strix]